MKSNTAQLTKKNKALLMLAIAMVIVTLTVHKYINSQHSKQHSIPTVYALEHNVEQTATATIASTNSEQSRRYSYSASIGKQHERSNQEIKRQAIERPASDGSNYDESALVVSEDGPVVSVYISSEKRVEKLPIERYVLSVALAELPGSFELEAIKAQMIAIRTYITRRLLQASEQVEYLVTDTTRDQVYLKNDKVQQYAQEYPEYYQKFVQAVKETEGWIISYQDEPIDAVFFSTSNGYTENADQVWGQQVAYLQSVASPWDAELSPNFETEFSYSFEELYERLNLKNSRRNGKVSINHVSRNESGRIESLDVNGASFTGKELREKLELSSTDMQWAIDHKNKRITFVCFGYGHGVGLSQWGANGMAQQGYLANEIIEHYYTDIELEQLNL